MLKQDKNIDYKFSLQGLKNNKQYHGKTAEEIFVIWHDRIKTKVNSYEMSLKKMDLMLNDLPEYKRKKFHEIYKFNEIQLKKYRGLMRISKDNNEKSKILEKIRLIWGLNNSN